MISSESFGASHSCYSPGIISGELPMGKNHAIMKNGASLSGGHTDQRNNLTYPIYVTELKVPCLKVVGEPQPNFRFRYLTELQTERHGFLLSRSVNPQNKEWVSVQLENWHGQGDVCVRYSLVTDTPERSQHFHRLGKKTADNQIIAPEYYQYNVMTRRENNCWTAEFPGLSILREKKSRVKQMIVDRQKANGILICNNEELKLAWCLRDTVRIKFEALAVVNGNLQGLICQPVYSEPIRHMKNKKGNEHRIVKVCKAEGLCTGDEEISIFVEKVDQNDIGIRFFQNGDQYEWSAEAELIYVHHGLAIAFKTPPYCNRNIQENVTVQFHLFSRNNSKVSKPKTFTYLPVIKMQNQFCHSCPIAFQTSGPSQFPSSILSGFQVTPQQSQIPAQVDRNWFQQPSVQYEQLSQYKQKLHSPGNELNVPSDFNVGLQRGSEGHGCLFNSEKKQTEPNISIGPGTYVDFDDFSLNDFHQMIDDINFCNLTDLNNIAFEDYQTDDMKSNNLMKTSASQRKMSGFVRQQPQPISAGKKLFTQNCHGNLLKAANHFGMTPLPNKMLEKIPGSQFHAGNVKDLASFHVAVSSNKTEDAKLLTTKEKYDGNSTLSTALEKSVKDVLALLDKTEVVNMQRSQGSGAKYSSGSGGGIEYHPQDTNQRLVPLSDDSSNDTDSEFSSDSENDFKCGDEDDLSIEVIASEGKITSTFDPAPFKFLVKEITHAAVKLKIENSSCDKVDDISKPFTFGLNNILEDNPVITTKRETSGSNL